MSTFTHSFNFGSTGTSGDNQQLASLWGSDPSKFQTTESDSSPATSKHDLLGTKDYTFKPYLDTEESKWKKCYSQHICAHERFAEKSSEELRFEDQFKVSATAGVSSVSKNIPNDYWLCGNQSTGDGWNGDIFRNDQIYSSWGTSTVQRYSSWGTFNESQIDSNDMEQPEKSEEIKQNEEEIENQKIWNMKNVKDTVDIHAFIVDQVAMKSQVSKTMAKRCLICSQWDVDVAINKIRALQRFGFESLDQNLIDRDSEECKQRVETQNVDTEIAKEKDQKERCCGGGGEVVKDKENNLNGILEEIQALNCETKKSEEKETVNAEEYNNVKVDEFVLPDIELNKEITDNAFGLLFGS